MLDDLLDPFTACLDSESMQRLSHFVLPPTVTERMSLLAGKANEGSLSDAERSSYEAAINAADILAILTLKAQQRLGTSIHP